MNVNYLLLLSIWVVIAIFPNHVVAKEYAIIYSGEERSYLLRKPASLNQVTQPKPAIIVLHGGGGNGRSAEKITDFTKKALPKGFMVAYPNGSSRFDFTKKGKTWNAKHCCGYAMTSHADDIGFINALIDDLINNHDADPHQIYVTGMSNGAMLTHLVGIHLSHRISAISTVIGGMFGGEDPPSSALPALIINGAQDKSIQIEGGHLGLHKKASDGTPFMPAAYQAQFWANANQCNASKNQSEQNQLIKTSYECPPNANVIYYIVKDGAHSWPGGNKVRKSADDPSHAIDATQVIIDFFLSHPSN